MGRNKRYAKGFSCAYWNYTTVILHSIGSDSVFNYRKRQIDFDSCIKPEPRSAGWMQLSNPFCEISQMVLSGQKVVI